MSLGFRPALVNDSHAVILGSWEYSTLNQGFNFQKGVVVFSIEEGQLKGNVTIGEEVIPMRNLIFEKDRVRAYIFVKGVQVDLYLKFDMDYSFEGTVSNPSGYIKVMGCKKD
jgi:hypothetical protein